MSFKSRSSTRLWIGLAIFTIVAGLTVFMSGQQRGRMADPQSSMHVPILSRGPQSAIEFPGIVDDWTNHHLVFSNPGTEEDAIRDGRYEAWVRIVNDPRYIMQQLRRRSPAQGPAAEYVASMNELALGQETGAGQELRVGELRDLLQLNSVLATKGKKQPIDRDWYESLGATTSQSYISYPAKWSFSTSSASCSGDYVVYPTGGSSTQASIIAYYNLYNTGCTTYGAVPEVDWAYNTGGTVTLAPVLYYGGAQLAVIQSSSSNVASLVLVRYPSPGTTGQGGLASPTTPNAATSASAYYSGSGCAAPCMFSIALNGNPNDLTSSPYYDWGTDSLYVGDSAGNLHKFNPVFAGVPAEVVGSGWPLTLNSSNSVSSPVYDATSACVFVGDTGGYLYSVNSGNSGSVCTSTTASKNSTSSRLDHAYGIRDGPLVDSSAEMVYAFVGYDSSGSGGVFQLPASFSSGSGTEVTVGTGDSGNKAYQLAGAFDNAYYTSSNSTSPSGNLYACGYPYGPSTLYQIPITNNSMSTTANTGPELSNGNLYYGYCSAVTEFFNTSVGTATGTVTMESGPSSSGSGSWVGKQVTIAGTTYTFESTLSAVNQVLLYTSSTTANNEARTAQNFYAVVNGVSGDCYSSGCVRSGQAANAKVTASYTSGNTYFTVTSKTAGSNGGFTMTSWNSSDVNANGGNFGTDYIFLSVFAGTESGCTDSSTMGCVMSFNLTTPSNFSSSMTPLGTLNTAAVENSFATGGIIIDNATTSPAGSSQIYFQLTDASGTTPCSSAGNCAVQASQAGP